MRYKKHLSRGDTLAWVKFPGQRGRIVVDDRTHSNRRSVPVQIRSRGPWKRLMQRMARFFDKLAY